MNIHARHSDPGSWWRPTGVVGLTAVLLSAVSVASAQPRDSALRDDDVLPEPRSPDPLSRHVFIEANGGYGISFGETEYLPAGMPGDYQHPIVHGYSFGGTAGFNVHESIALIASYDYSASESRTGHIDSVVDSVIGDIDYHTIVAGLRFGLPLEFGALQAEFAVGVVLPFDTVVKIDYGPALSQLPTPIVGAGLLRTHFSVGVGGHALVGYRIPLGDFFYLAANLKARFFQSENSGERTELVNYVQDFTALPPTATTAVVEHGDGAASPQTESVVDVRGQLAVGVSF